MNTKTTITQTALLTGAVSAMAVVGIAGALLVGTTQSASAHPAYAQKTGQTCGVCHLNPKGGGTLTKSGTKWFIGGMKAKFRK